MNTPPVLIDIVLLGGGHSHALLIRQWAMKPLPGVRLTLISRDVLTPYSGMLPGYVAGHYTSEEIHIDLARLCRWAGVRFIEATVTGLDLDARQVRLLDRPAIDYDCVSIDTGSTPDQSIPGSAEFTVPVKPIHRLQEHWQSFVQNLAADAPVQHIAVVGSGVGGFELLMSIDHALRARDVKFELHWVIRGSEPIRAQPPSARRLALSECEKKSITAHTLFDVKRVEQTALHAVDGRQLAVDHVFWVTAAAAPDWPGAAGLKTDQRGFIATNAYLQSQSHDSVFASGDVGTQTETPAEKAGVFAVRQAPVLFENLRRYVLGKPLKIYKPQSQFLSLMALGQKEAIASRNGIVLSGQWVWRWKDHIDKTFMARFTDLPELRMKATTLDDVPMVLREQASLESETAAMRCGGCGAKVGPDVLSAVMRQLDLIESEDVLSGVTEADDAAVVTLGDRLLVQSVDQFRAMLDDHYVLGKVAALHALNDVYAMQGQAHSVLALVTLPFSSSSIQQRDLYQLMSGALTQFNQAGCSLIGGHTGEGAELMLGFSVNGVLAQNSPELSAVPQPDDRLILTKPVGTGVVLAGHMQNLVDGVAVRECVRSMLLDQAEAVKVFKRFTVNGMTDVTGFGLLGHLQRLLAPASLGCELDCSLIPLLPSALKLSRQGVSSSLLTANQNTEAGAVVAQELEPARVRLLSDPQTSGGLLACVPAAQAEACVAALQGAGFTEACSIGRVGGTDIALQ
ncbi:MAG: selenide, water dikinase SelD [Gammaproteobacteria bacterium]|nr:selenide, water dikinase SelD [Gammaproteobacteria bacterium]